MQHHLAVRIVFANAEAIHILSEPRFPLVGHGVECTSERRCGLAQSLAIGLKQLGFSLFLWGVVVTTVPLILAMYLGKYLFRFDDAILLGCCSGARTTTASLGMVNDRAKSQIPGLGYTVTYAVGNTLLTIWGMVLVMMLT